MEGADVVPLISMRRKVDFSKAAKDAPNGTLSGSWEASTTPVLNIASNRIATPGAKPATQITQASKTTIPYSPVIINEYRAQQHPRQRLDRAPRQGGSQSQKLAFEHYHWKDQERVLLDFPG